MAEGLAIADLRVEFGEVIALDALTMNVAPGQLVGFLGPNGAGKTTAMRSIVGLLRPQRGSITWQGRPIDAAARRRVGYMPEERGLYPRMRIHDQVAYFAQLAGLERAQARAAASVWLERLGLAERSNDRVQELSHGNQQRVQLAVALAAEPALLVLDEPFSGLDPVAVQVMIDVIAEQSARGAAVLFSSHQLDLVEELCERVVIIDRGQLVQAGKVDELRAAATERRLTVTYPHGARDSRLVERDADLAALLRDASARGEIIGFSFEPPTLSEIFLKAVGS